MAFYTLIKYRMITKPLPKPYNYSQKHLFVSTNISDLLELA